MAILISIFFFLWPIFSIPLVLIGYLYDKKHLPLYAMLFGMIMGLAAYYLQPPTNFDLYRHHLLVEDFSTYSFSYFLKTLVETSSEPMQALITYAVSLTHNYDLLQFFIVSIGYTILLYIMGDYAKRNNIKKSYLFITLLFTLASFICINFFSGLWNSFAMLVFSLAFYWDVGRQKSRFITYPLYVITPLIHSAMFFPLLLLIIFKFFKEKVNLKLILVITTILIVPSIALPIINNLTDITIFAQLEPMYNAYFLNGSQFSYLYGADIVFMEFLKITLYVGACVYLKDSSDQFKKIRSFVIILSFSTLLLVINSIVSLRFVLMVQFIGSLLLMMSLSKIHGRAKILFISYIMILTTLFTFYQYMTLRNMSFEPFSLNHLLDNVVQLFFK